MKDEIKAQIEHAIKCLCKEATSTSVTPDGALKFSQSALNLAHTAQVLTQVALTK